jgi:adenosylcobinamide-phosphate synthase
MTAAGVNAIAVPVGLLADVLLGEPPARWHPVARFGGLMQCIEAATYGDERWRGGVHLATGVTVGMGAGIAMRRLVGSGPATALAVAVCSAGRMLDRAALAVAGPLERGGSGDLSAARERVSALVGRDTSDLDAAGISRAVIESVAENSVDAVTATLWWAAIGGAPAALAHRAVNTLDAMVGHRTPRYARFGWASARADDVLNWVPARVTAVAVAAVRPRRAAAVWRAVRRDAPQHPSPNGGVIEAAFAAALGVQLGGTNRYGDVVEDRGTLGDGRTSAASDIAPAIRLRRHATAAVCVALVAARIGCDRWAARHRPPANIA